MATHKSQTRCAEAKTCSLLPLKKGWDIKCSTNPSWHAFPMYTSLWQQMGLTVAFLKTPLNTSTPHAAILTVHSCKNMLFSGGAATGSAEPHRDMAANRVPITKTVMSGEDGVWNLAIGDFESLIFYVLARQK